MTANALKEFYTTDLGDLVTKKRTFSYVPIAAVEARVTDGFTGKMQSKDDVGMTAPVGAPLGDVVNALKPVFLFDAIPYPASFNGKHIAEIQLTGEFRQMPQSEHRTGKQRANIVRQHDNVAWYRRFFRRMTGTSL